MFVLTANYAHVHDHRTRPKASEWSTYKKCCAVKDPDRYEECFPEPPVEEVQLALQDKLKLNAGDPEGGAHPHNHPHWEYVYDFEKTPVMLGKKYWSQFLGKNFYHFVSLYHSSEKQWLKTG